MERIYRAAKYIRTSCPDNETQYSDSVANQRKLIDAFIKAHPEIILVAEKIDEGYSGLLSERPALNELLADVEAGNINCIIVKDLSRWARDYIETGRYLRDYFPAHAVRFISIVDNIDSIRPDGFDKLMVLLKSIFSEQYSRDISIKTRSALIAKRKQGKYVGAIPIYGYQKSIEDKHILIPDPNTATVVQSIFDMKLHGMSAASIAAKLNSLGFPSPLSYKRKCGIAHPTGGFSDKHNVSWSAMTILRMLRDENYTGTLVQGRQLSLNYKARNHVNLDESEWIRTKNAHLAIISYADYEAVQRTLAMDTRIAPKHKKVHTFSGILICECCGGNMTRRTTPLKEKPHIYYYCRKGKRNGCDSPSAINEDELVSIVAGKVRERIADIERLSLCLSNTQIHKAIQSERNQQTILQDMKARDLHRYKLYLSDSRTEKLLTDAEYQMLYSYYDREIIRLDAELTSIWKESHYESVLHKNHFEWVQSFLQFTHMVELDRVAVVKMILNIHVHSSEEVIVNFAYQSEYEQLCRYSALGGHTNGQEKP